MHLKLVLFKVDKRNGKIVWKLADFGIAYVLQSPNQRINEKRGIGYWMAPEMRVGRGYATQVDMFAIGRVLEETHKSDSETSSHWKAAMASLTDKNPDIRWNARQLYRKAKDVLELKKRQRATEPRKSPTISEHTLSKIGVPFKVLRVNSQGEVVDGDPKKLTPSILRQTSRVLQMFKATTKLRVQKINYVFNPELYADFEAAKNELKQKGHYKKREILTFHGTLPENVSRYVIQCRHD